MDMTAPFGYKKDGTPRTRRAPGTGLRYQGPSKPKSIDTHKPTVTRTSASTAQAPRIPLSANQLQLGRQVICPVPGCGLNFTRTKDPQNSLLVHVRYKAGKSKVDPGHQLELEKMKSARKTDRKCQYPPF